LNRLNPLSGTLNVSKPSANPKNCQITPKYITLAFKPLLKVIRICLMLVSVLVFGPLFSQNYPIYSNYITNPYLVNPAEAASPQLNVFSSYRTQWGGLAKIGMVGFRTLINDTRVGIGFKASSFKRGFLNSSDASFTYAYGVPVDKSNKVYFGLSGGILSNAVDWSVLKPDDLSDGALGTMKGGIMPSMSFGVLYRNSSGINLGLVLPQMFRAESLSNSFAMAPQDNVVLMAYYSNWHPQVKVNSHNKSRKSVKKGKNKGSPLEVFSMLRYSDVGVQVEGTAKFNFQSSMWLSATYRKSSGIIPGLGINMNNFSLAYYYESGIAGDIPLKTHEVALNLVIGSEKKFRGEKKKPEPKTPPVNPRPRFGDPDPTQPNISENSPKNKNNKNKNVVVATTVPDTKKDPVVTTTEEKKDPVVTDPHPRLNTDNDPLATTTEEKKDPIVTTTEEKKDPIVTTTEEKKDPVVTTTEVKKDPVVTTTEEKKDPVVTTTEVKKDPVVTTTEEKKDPVVTTTEEKKDPVVTTTEEKKDPVATTTEEEEKLQHQEEEEKIARLTEHKDNPTEEHNEEGHPHAERHEFVKRGSHVSEMDLGDYVIVGVFKGEANAKHMSDELKKLGFSEVDYGYLSEKAVWYVHIAGSNDIEEARTRRNKYRKMRMFKDAWLLTVHQ